MNGLIMMLKAMLPNVDWQAIERDAPELFERIKGAVERFEALEKQVALIAAAIQEVGKNGVYTGHRNGSDNGIAASGN